MPMISYECGASLRPEVRLLTPDELPADGWVRSFNHLHPRPGEPLLAPERVAPLAEGLRDGLPGGSVYLLLPCFERIEGEFSESIGWFGLAGEYGDGQCPRGPETMGWNSHDLPLVRVLSRPASDVGDAAGMEREVRAVLEVSRPMR